MKKIAATGSTAVISKIQTSVDGGYKVTLDFTEADLTLIKDLMEIKKDQQQVIVAFQRLQ